MKTYDVEVTVFGIPEDKFDDELLAIETFIKERGMSVQYGIGRESEASCTTDNPTGL